MTVTIELPDELEGALKAQAQAQGVSVASFTRSVLEEALIPKGLECKPRPPLKTGRGMWAKYGPAPSAEEIDENRRDMFRGFAEDF